MNRYNIKKLLNFQYYFNWSCVCSHKMRLLITSHIIWLLRSGQRYCKLLGIIWEFSDIINSFLLVKIKCTIKWFCWNKLFNNDKSSSSSGWLLIYNIISVEFSNEPKLIGQKYIYNKNTGFFYTVFWKWIVTRLTQNIQFKNLIKVIYSMFLSNYWSYIESYIDI